MLRPPLVATLFPYTTLFRSCLDNGHEYGRADRTQGRNRTEQFPSLVLLALGEEFLPRLLAQENQCVELLVVKLGPATQDRKSTRLNSSHRCSSYAVFCLNKN